jgi:hypothetical protein
MRSRHSGPFTAPTGPTGHSRSFHSPFGGLALPRRAAASLDVLGRLWGRRTLDRDGPCHGHSAGRFSTFCHCVGREQRCNCLEPCGRRTCKKGDCVLRDRPHRVALDFMFEGGGGLRDFFAVNVPSPWHTGQCARAPAVHRPRGRSCINGQCRAQGGHRGSGPLEG